MQIVAWVVEEVASYLAQPSSLCLWPILHEVILLGSWWRYTSVRAFSLAVRWLLEEILLRLEAHLLLLLELALLLYIIILDVLQLQHGSLNVVGCFLGVRRQVIRYSLLARAGVLLHLAAVFVNHWRLMLSIHRRLVEN